LAAQSSSFPRAGWEQLGTIQQSRLELGCVSAIDSNGRTIWIADAHRGDGNRFVVHADEKLTAFVELESAIRSCDELPLSRHS